MNVFFYLNFVKKIKLKKIINFLKLYISYLLSVTFKKAFKFGNPYSISIEPTTMCNLKCPQCPTGKQELTRPKGFISFNSFKIIIDQIYPYLLNLFLYFQGEPLLNRDLFKLITYANSKNIFTVTSTNGHYLNEENCKNIVYSKLDKIIISLDGTNQASYKKYRKNGNFEKVIKGINKLTETKLKLNSKTPFIEIQFIVLKTNEHQINDFKKLCKDLKINKISLKSAQIYNYQNDNEFIPNIKKYSRYVKENDSWEIKNKLKNKCWRLWNSSVITWNGEVLPCCFDKDAKYSFGNVLNQNFKKIIKNEKFYLFANKLLTNRKSIDICNNCSE